MITPANNATTKAEGIALPSLMVASNPCSNPLQATLYETTKNIPAKMLRRRKPIENAFGISPIEAVCPKTFYGVNRHYEVNARLKISKKLNVRQSRQPPCQVN